MSKIPPSTPSLSVKPEDLSALFNSRELSAILENHNNILAASYKTTFPEPTAVQKVAAFDKFCRAAILPGFDDRPEAFIPITKLDMNELKTILWMLENADIHSDFAWIPVAGNTTALHLAIRDQDNQHIIRLGKPAPVSVIAIRHDALTSQDKLNEMLSAHPPVAPVPVPAPVTLPNIEILQAKNKGLYVPIADLSQEQRELLAERFIEQKLHFRYYPSPSQGEVYIVPYEDWPGLQQVQSKIEIENLNDPNRTVIMGQGLNPRETQYHLDRATHNVRAQLADLEYKPPTNE